MTDSTPAALEVLRCMAIDHRIGGVLFLDLDPMLLRPLASWLLDAVGDDTRRPVSLGPWHTDDDLWLGLRFADGAVQVRPGLLARNNDRPTPVIVVPDLAHASLAVQRAAVSLIGSEVAVAERHGTSDTWSPRACWLAVCDRADAASLSAHLLDRFPVRCDGASLNELLVEAEIRLAADDSQRLTEEIGELLGPVGPIPARRPIPFSAGALDQVVALGRTGPGERRTLTLGRMSRALALLSGRDEVAADDVEQAADLMGITAVTPATTEPSPKDTPDPDRRHETAEAPERPADPAGVAANPATLIDRQVVPAPDHALDPADLYAEPNLIRYPEDDPEALPSPEPLRFPPSSRARRRGAAGAVLGSEPTRGLDDLAIVPTLLAALRFRPLRDGEPGRLHLRAGDLRRHRRHPEPASALILVLDHSCLRTWDADAAMAPFLRWALRQRAAVSVVEFGHRDAPDPLQATRYRVRDIADPRVAASLNREPGQQASPLAHAMDLAAAEAQRLARRTRSPVDDALVLVVTDGRGNVPLHMSLGEPAGGPVARRGVEDTITVADRLRTIRGVRSVVLAPDVAAYPDLPWAVADAMGGTVMIPTPASPR
ncbi:hypothetical protein KZ829_07335 [Actinoplanes hulinensis]|uniref:ChlI/MoxR AAA lid domain-containing protein n=1 Tax=Actinoplanes hulinensis TaxID=1144547 RepID=A0ABS7AXQ8_9ACTN|nr:hypothetical protein [Actinoplanes hulinensis]MBW6433556.1 hypothetical protein [Actinoplanes hulinensis]